MQKWYNDVLHVDRYFLLGTGDNCLFIALGTVVFMIRVFRLIVCVLSFLWRCENVL